MLPEIFTQLKKILANGAIAVINDYMGSDGEVLLRGLWLAGEWATRQLLPTFHPTFLSVAQLPNQRPAWDWISGSWPAGTEP